MKASTVTIPVKKNHMEIHWHDYADKENPVPITKASLDAKASVIGRVGIMMLACGTGAWRVRSSMNELSELMNITCTVDIGLMSINYTCFDGDNSFTQSLCLTNTGVNTSQLNRLEKFVIHFQEKELLLSCDEIHSALDEIERIHSLYSPVALAVSAALACGAFTFLLGGGMIEMLCAFIGAGIGNYIRCKLTKHHFTLFLCIISSVSAACFTYTVLLKFLQLVFEVNLQHEAGYICSMLFIIPGFPFITSGIDLAKLDMRSGIERLMYYYRCDYDRLDPCHAARAETYSVSSPEPGTVADDPASFIGRLLWRLWIFHDVQQSCPACCSSGADRCCL